MRCAVDQDCQQPPDPAGEERDGQHVDVEAFVLNVAGAPQQRDPVTEKQPGEESILPGHRWIHRHAADDRARPDREMCEGYRDHEKAEKDQQYLKCPSHRPLRVS